MLACLGGEIHIDVDRPRVRNLPQELGDIELVDLDGLLALALVIEMVGPGGDQVLQLILCRLPGGTAVRLQIPEPADDLAHDHAAGAVEVLEEFGQVEIVMSTHRDLHSCGEAGEA